VSKRNLLVFLAAPLLVLFAGAGVARWVERDDVTKQLAVFAAVVALGGFLVNYGKVAYDVWDKERDRRKKENDAQERVQATPFFTWHGTADSVACLDVYNAGAATVHIRRVALVVRDAAGTATAEQLYVGDSSDTRCKLGPKDHARFQLFTGDKRFQGVALAKLSPENLWIVVESFTGELARVRGEDVQAAVEKSRKEAGNREREWRRIVASRDRVNARPTFRPAKYTVPPNRPLVGVELYNDGDAPVNVKRVALVVRGDSGEEVALGTNERPRNLQTVTWDESVMIAPKHTVQFHLRSSDPKFGGDALCALSPECLWVVVESANGEAARIPGEKVQDAIQKGGQVSRSA
jgi:hypothetical protein